MSQTPNLSGLKYFWTQDCLSTNIFGAKFFRDPHFFNLNLSGLKIFLNMKFFMSKIFLEFDYGIGQHVLLLILVFFYQFKVTWISSFLFQILFLFIGFVTCLLTLLKEKALLTIIHSIIVWKIGKNFCVYEFHPFFRYKRIWY